MNTRITTAWMSLVILLAAFHAQANSLIDGSVEAGQGKSITCTACHGPAGNSVNPLWPNIAGQSATYILTQMQAFKPDADGRTLRSDPLMTPQATMLTEQDMRDLAVYFESLPAAAMAVADPGKVDKGQALYRGGDAASGAAACLACHGPTGRGNPAANYPALQGQHSTYTAKQLRDYATEARKSDGKTRIMRDIAARLSDDDINAVASYVQGLR